MGDVGHGNNSGNMGEDKGSNSHGTNQNSKAPNIIEMMDNIFKNLEVFKVEDQEEKDLIKNSWGD
jgi:hypothetical protein